MNKQSLVPTVAVVFALTRGGCDISAQLVRPDSMNYEDWSVAWASQLPVSAMLTQGTTSAMWGVGGSVTLRTYSVHLELENRTRYTLGTGHNLYIIETATKESPEEDPRRFLTVAGGRFTQSPLEDYSGVVEFRGSDAPRTASSGRTFGLANTHSRSESGGIVRRLGPVLQFTGGGSEEETPSDFGRADPSEYLVIDAELQLAVMVKADRMRDVAVLSPELVFQNEEGERASFRYVLRFEKDEEGKESGEEGSWALAEDEKTLLEMTPDVLLPIVQDSEAALWRRVSAAHWVGRHGSADAAPALTAIVSARGTERDAVRRAAVLALGVGKHVSALEQIQGRFRDSSEDESIRRASLIALGDLGDERALPFLLSVASAGDKEFSRTAISSLGTLGDRGAVQPLLQMLANAKKEDVSNISSSLSLLVQNSDLERLTRIAKNPEGLSSPGVTGLIGLIGDIGTPDALSTLIDLSATGREDVRKAACDQLAEHNEPEAVEALISALSNDVATEVRNAAASSLGRIGDEAAVDPLIEALQVQKVRSRAVTSLGQIGHPRAAQPLLDMLDDKEQSVRRGAISALVKIGEPAVPTLVAALQHPSADRREAVAEILGDLEDVRALEPLVATLLGDRVTEVRKSAAQALVKLGGEQAVEALTTVLRDEAPEMREVAARGLGALGDKRAVNALIETAADEKESVRIASVRSLGTLGDTQAVGALIEATTDKEESVRTAAARSLGQLKDNQAIEPLISLLSGEEKSRVRNAAKNGLKEIGRPASHSLVRALSNPDAKVRQGAAEVLGEIEVVSAVQPLVELLGDRSADVREAAAVSLGKLKALDATEPLIMALQDRDRSVRRQAHAALKRITGHDLDDDPQAWSDWWHEARTGPVRLEPREYCSNHSDTAIATFEDANLEAAIRTALSVGAQEDLTCGLISGLTVLDAASLGITSLMGVQNLTGLTNLSLSNNSISDIRPLSGLGSLTRLYLDDNPNLTDIQPLLDNTGLGAGDTVNLESTGVSCTDIAALEAKVVEVQCDCP